MSEGPYTVRSDPLTGFPMVEKDGIVVFCADDYNQALRVLSVAEAARAAGVEEGIRIASESIGGTLTRALGLDTDQPQQPPGA